MSQRTHDAARGIDEPAPGALGHVGCRGEMGVREFLAAGARGAFEDGAAQVVGSGSRKEGVG